MLKIVVNFVADNCTLQLKPCFVIIPTIVYGFFRPICTYFPIHDTYYQEYIKKGREYRTCYVSRVICMQKITR